MHARHRSPGNGYRSSNSMGMGLGASRISPDSSASARGHSFYNSEYRSFNNRGFGRGQGQSKSFQQPPQPPPCKGDILMEAGRLAAEYLVSKGLLPQGALSGKWQNGSLKKQIGDYQDLRLQEDIIQEGRTSAHARLGSGASDGAAGRRRYTDDFNLKNNAKGRRRAEYYNRSNSSEWGREYGRSGSWSDRRVPLDMEGDDDTVSGHYEEQQVGEDVGDGMHKSGQSGSAPETEEATDMDLGAECNSSTEMGSKASSVGKDETDGEPSKASSDLTNLNSGNQEINDCKHNEETEKQTVLEDSTIQHSAQEGDLSSKCGSDLLSYCNFAKIPTKTRTALTHRVPKVDQVPNKEEENTSGIGPANSSEVSVHDGTLDFTTDNLPPNTGHDSEHPDPEASKPMPAQFAEDERELGPGCGEQDKCMRSHSFPDKAFMHDDEQKLSQGVPGFRRSTSVKERGEKRTAEDSDMNEVTKKPREWLPSMVSTANEHPHLSNLSQNQESLEEGRASCDQQMIMAVREDSLVNSHQFPKSGCEPCVDYVQEKQLFPSSFKICDLNLMEASDTNDNHCNNPVLMYPSIAASKKEAAQIDVDLSMNNSNLAAEYLRSTDNGKNIEVIDLDNEEDNAFDDSQRKSADNGKNVEVIDLDNEKVNAFDNSQKKETSFTGTEGFPNSAQNAGDIDEVPDSYDSLTISELLTTFSSCTSVTEDINPLQNEMDLHNVEGALGDDDSIYMSLGEIPLSFIPAWEQPTPQEYGKPF